MGKTIQALEERVHELESIVNKQSQLLDNIPNLLFMTNQNGDVLFVGGNTSELYVPRDSIISKNITTLLPKDVSDTIFQALHEAQNRGYSRQEYSLRHEDTKKTYSLRTNHNQGLFVHSIADITSRKQMEHELHSKKTFFVQIIDNMFEMVSTTDSKGIFTFVGGSYNILGYEEKELVGTYVNSYVHPDDRTFIESELQTSLETLKEKTVEYRYRKKDGSYVWLETHGKFIFDEGSISSILFTSRDISQRKESEILLEKTEHRFQEIFDTVENISVQGYAMDGTVTYWNNASEKIYGYTKEEALGKNLLDLIIPEDLKEEVERTVARMRTTRETIPPEKLTLQRKNGSSVPVYSSHTLIKNSKGETEFFCIDVDLTDQKKAEEALYLQSLVLDQISDHVTITDLDGIITYVNQAEEQLFNTTKKELLGLPIKEFDEDPNQGATQDEILSKTLEKGTWRGEVVNLTSDNQQKVMDCRTQLIYDELHKPIAISGISTDITEQKKSQSKLEKALQERELLLREVHHRVKNNLELIRSLVQLQKEATIDEGKDYEYLENIDSRIIALSNAYKNVYQQASSFENIDARTYYKNTIK